MPAEPTVTERRLRHAAGMSRLKRDLSGQVAGDVCFDAASRAMYAHDSSNYRQVPLGVVRPRSSGDVAAALEVCRAHDTPVLGRGGGTSLAGQACNHGVVLDFSRYMNRVLEIDPERATARVEAGVVLDDLRAAAEPHGLTFGPDPSTHDRCTLGGMIGNNSCGTHAVLSEFYGPGPRTADQLVRLGIVTYDGLRMTVGKTSDRDFEQIQAKGGREAEIYRRLRELAHRHADRIRRAFPDIPRRVSGYNLPALLPERGFDLAQALSGTESTCVTVIEAEVRLCPALPHRCLVILGYPDVYSAADHVVEVRAHRPVGCEGLDDRLVELMRRKDMHTGELSMLPEGGGWLLVELGADSATEARAQAQALVDSLPRSSGPSSRIIEDRAAQAKVWTLRESSLGATAFVPGRPDAWPGWEDSAVAPERLGQYLRALRALLDDHGYHASLYGHFAQGCVHCRIDFDYGSAEGIRRYMRFTDAAARLAVAHGGSLSGEHGDGQARGDLLPIMFDSEIIDAFREFKAIWDPGGRMNPGKVIDARSRGADLKQSSFAPFPAETVFSYPDDGGRFSHATMRCVGVGSCRRQGGGVMCPSYMVTREEKHSTRGRARLLYEMMQQDVIEQGWQSEEVFDALDLCLACKGCKSDCPVQVDMATYKAEFLAHYYREKSRPRTAYTLGMIHRWARLGSVWPALANLAAQAPGLRGAVKGLAGVSSERQLPRFADQSFRRWFRRRTRPDAQGRRVLLWPDTFNNHFYPQTLIAMTRALEQAGFAVDIPGQSLCCGRPLYDFGMVELAKRLWEQTFRALGSDIEAGTPVIGAEPSCVAAFRDELPGLFPGDERAARLSQQTHTLGEALGRLLDDYEPPRIARTAVVQPHCHHRSVMGFSAERTLIERAGLDVRAELTGCCGMAGAFGFERDKFPVSIAIAERELAPALQRAPSDALVVADGFSCREQIRHVGKGAVHLVELLADGATGTHVAESTHKSTHKHTRVAEKPRRSSEAHHEHPQARR